MRNLFKYSKYYSGVRPQFIEGNIFRMIVSLNEAYPYDGGTIGNNGIRINETNVTKNETKLEPNEELLISLIRKNPSIPQTEIKMKMKLSLMTIKRIMGDLQKKGVIERKGSSRKGVWVIKEWYLK